MPRVEMRDPDKVYHPMPVSDLVSLAPDFDWAAYSTGSPVLGSLTPQRRHA